jgi:hypothetical protein
MAIILSAVNIARRKPAGRFGPFVRSKPQDWNAIQRKQPISKQRKFHRAIEAQL